MFGSVGLPLSHSPSFSMCLLISNEDFARGLFSNAVCSTLVRIRADGGLGVLRLSTEEMLLLTEWPRIVDMELSVSEDMVESGRGMYSTLSEKPTVRRDGGLGSASSSAGPNRFEVSWAGVFDPTYSDPCDAIGCSSGVFGRL